jgi:hypothetical protein
MAAYANAHTLKNFAVLDVDTVDMRNQILSITLTPEQPVLTQRAVDGSVAVDVDVPVWTAAITYHNSRKTGSFGKALDVARAAGDVMDFEVQFVSGAGEDTVTFSAQPLAAGFGGETGAWHVQEIVLQVVDQPVFATAS